MCRPLSCLSKASAGLPAQLSQEGAGRTYFPTLRVMKARPSTATPVIIIPRIATVGIESGRLSAESTFGPPGDTHPCLTSNVPRADACIPLTLAVAVTAYVPVDPIFGTVKEAL